MLDKKIDFGPFSYLIESKEVKVSPPKKGESADLRYKINREAINKAMSIVHKLIDDMDKDQKKDNSDYSFAADAHRILQLLNEIIEFLG